MLAAAYACQGIAKERESTGIIDLARIWKETIEFEAPGEPYQRAG
jgi:hypothetical protein